MGLFKNNFNPFCGAYLPIKLAAKEQDKREATKSKKAGLHSAFSSHGYMTNLWIRDATNQSPKIIWAIEQKEEE